MKRPDRPSAAAQEDNAADGTRDPPAARRPVPAVSRARLWLTSLVPLHHSNVSHGAAGFWFFRDPSLPAGFASPGLSALAGLNQSFFMGEFFLLAGLFAPSAADKRGSGLAYLRDRAKRLGSPTLLYFALVRPVVVALRDVELAGFADAGRTFEPLGTWLPKFADRLFSQTVWPSSLADLVGDGVTAGPMWFTFALMTFFLGFVGFRSLAAASPPNHPPSSPALQPSRSSLIRSAILYYLLIVPPATFLARMVFPLARPASPIVPVWLASLRSRLEWQLGYFPGFITAFALGCIGGNHLPILFPINDKNDDETPALASRLLLFSALVVPVLPLIAALGYNHPMEFTQSSFGGLNIPAAAYAAWEPCLAVGIVGYSLFGRFPAILGRVVDQLSSRFRTASLLETLDRASMATYVFHPIPTVTASIVLPHLFASLGLDWTEHGTLVRAGLAGLGSIVGSWLVGVAMQRLPGASYLL